MVALILIDRSLTTNPHEYKKQGQQLAEGYV